MTARPVPTGAPMSGAAWPHASAAMSTPVPHPELVVCDECDAVHRRMPLGPGEVANCRRCGSVLGRGERLSLQAQLALALGALLFLLLGNLSPIVTLQTRGQEIPVTLPAAIAHTWQTGEALVAMLTAATALAMPLTVLVLRLYVLAALAAGRVPAGFVPAMHLLRLATRWSMVEVFMLGTLIAIVRSAGMVGVIPGVGIFSYAMVTLLLASITAAGLHRLWDVASGLQASHHAWVMAPAGVHEGRAAASEPIDADAPVPPSAIVEPNPAAPATAAPCLAHRQRLYSCAVCGLVTQDRRPAAAFVPAGTGSAAAIDPDPTLPAPHCPRCAGALHHRTPDSLQRTWSFLLAAVILYLPANLLPIMTTTSVLGTGRHTILGGIGELWHVGSWALAIIVFIASIAVPILKIMVLAMLAWTSQRRSREQSLLRTRLYGMVETIGHWSMLDVFVVVLLVGMIRFGAFGGVEPEPGLLAFGAVVVLTMLASSSFDPRLLWPDEPPSPTGPGSAQ